MARKRGREPESHEQQRMDPQAQSEAGAAGEAPEPAGEADGRLARLEQERAELEERYFRALADNENVRRRAAREAEECIWRAKEQLISELLPVLDNLSRALEAAEAAEQAAAEPGAEFEALKSGVVLIRRQLTEALERAGLERIEAVGCPFNPNHHEAIMQVEAREGEAPHQVVEELRPGYRLQERVVRPTLVKVTFG